MSKLKIQYSTMQGTKCAAAYIPVLIKNPATGKCRHYNMRLDTGADVSIIPERAVDYLGLESINNLLIQGATGKTGRLKAYRAELSASDEAFCEVFRVEPSDGVVSRSVVLHGLLGMDILGRLSLAFEAGTATIINKEANRDNKRGD